MDNLMEIRSRIWDLSMVLSRMMSSVSVAVTSVREYTVSPALMVTSNWMTTANRE